MVVCYLRDNKTSIARLPITSFFFTFYFSFNYGYKPIENKVKYIHDMNSVIGLGLGSNKKN